MKNLIASLALTLITIGAFAQTSIEDAGPQELGAVTVTIQGLNSDEGQLMIALYASDATWLKKEYKGMISEIKDGTATVVFEGVPYGTYAVSTFHDENSNDKLDAGLFGIPKEPYASSRGAKGMFGPPKWEDAKFEVAAQNTTEVIKY